jgi:hypothetical protein
VELFEQIRRDHEFEGLSKRALARKYSVHRRAVRQALESPVPPPRKRPVGRPAPRLGRYRSIVDGWLIADREVPRKQRHTAKRIFERLRSSLRARPGSIRHHHHQPVNRRELGPPQAAAPGPLQTAAPMLFTDRRLVTCHLVRIMH